jgi:hypothetical protein
MRALRIGHHGDRGTGDARQIGNLTGMIHAHLDDRRAMSRRCSRSRVKGRPMSLL